jgi:hypothetical protein
MNCNVLLDLEYPVGWSYSVATTKLTGYADIPKHCKGTLGALYSWSGRRGQVRTPLLNLIIFTRRSETLIRESQAMCETSFGNREGEYVKETAVDAEVWAECSSKGRSGPPFNINTYAKIDCKQSAMLSVDRQETSFGLKFYLNWKRC